ncbi:MAG: hypothetical protein C0399_12785 [Syntrophus sp. (in: bacteria)]|nr:hypothetical protein [Syntrophus sp. (in: bacteria)]MBA4419248.1 hypothetical protein [Syntrophus sp. (in: bacteria)]
MKKNGVFAAICLTIIAAGILLDQLSGSRVFAATGDSGQIAGYEQYSNPQLGITLSKPKNWDVSVVNGIIFLRQSRESSTGVFLLPILRAHPKMDAVSFIRFMHDQIQIEHPDLKIEERRSNRTNTVAEVAIRYTNKTTREVMTGFYLVSIEGGRGIFCGYEAPASRFDSSHAILRNVLKNLKLSPLAFYTGTSNDRVPPHKAVSPTIDISKLTVKLSADRTMYLAVPPDWTVGGGNYSLMATPPGEKMGVTATNDAQPKTRDPYTYLMKALLPFYRSSGTVIHKREANHDVMRFSQSQGYSSKAENFIGETTQGNGQKVLFWIMINAATLPKGGGFVSTLGFFAVPELFERNSTVLYAIAASMSPNQQEIMGRLRENLDRLGQASRTMSQTGDVVIQGLRSHTANWDRAMDKYNYYLSGEEARYSPLENRIYVVDSNLEKYAGNPRYPQETLTNVPDKLWNRLPHERNFK